MAFALIVGVSITDPGRPDVHRTIDAVWRLESARIIGGVARMVRDVGLAEELAQDALVTALEQWPRTGVPDNPGAWLMTIAKRRAVDRIRRDRTLDRKLEEIGHRQETGEAAGPGEDVDAVLDEDRIEDDVLRLKYHLLPSVRGDLLSRLGRYVEARAEFARAASLTRNAAERAALEKRAASERLT